MVKKKAIVVTKETTEADLKAFAEVLMAQIGPKPSNWNDIVKEAIKEYKKKQKEV